MAWISVHEGIIGGKLRELAKSIGCSQNEAIGILIRLWLWCINNADKDGYVIGADAEDVAEILSVGKAKEIEAEKVVEALIECEWMEAEDGSLLIHDWQEWQEPLYTFKERREKDKDRKRLERAKIAKEPKTEATENKEEQKPEPKKKSPYTTDFEKFWSAYPRKVGKGEAYKKYKARVNDGFREDDLYAAALNYANQCIREHTEEKYIKHAKTFLSDTMPFTDYIHRERRPQGAEIIPEDGANPFRR